MLVLPAAFLAARGQSWGLALPLLSWLPGPALPFVALAGVWLPFTARGREGGGEVFRVELPPLHGARPDRREERDEDPDRSHGRPSRRAAGCRRTAIKVTPRNSIIAGRSR